MEMLRLSPSRISEFSNCPQKYKYRAIDLLPEPPSIDAERGKLVHAVLEDLFEFPMNERSLENALSILPNKWNEQIEKQPELSALVLDTSEWISRASSLIATLS